MIALGCDHGGYELMQEVMKHLDELNIPYKNFGTYSTDSCDYPDYAKKVAHAVAQKECELGILICGTGIGISIAANKIHGIRAALCSDCYSAGVTREHNDSNVLCLGGRVVGVEVAKKIVEIFLDTSFSNEVRHLNRIHQIEE